MNHFKDKVAAHAITWGQDHFKALKEVSNLGFQRL